MDEAQKKLMGQRIKSLRERQGLSQDELASTLGMNRTNVSNYESGRTVPPGNIIRDLADFLKTNADYLLGRTDDSSHTRKNEEFDEEVRSLARDIQSFDPGNRDLLKDLIKTMRERGKEARDK
ncbi:helix-turn-helix domain-containing protein [Brevibacillus brevis]|uniref:helix-turn-helix domain-containing protein n=1 Tax=Brevibacillus brevis TaxID=1393 RepID=UPI00115AAF73|nr:helix-turn-helix transcriptional regulator [Lysinibacillus sp. SDF0063]TQR33996.1 XRE family transcriptional regulator [Lysinibacillus sp. SDF0063]